MSERKPRPPWDDYFAEIASVVAKRGDCTRRQVGAVIVDQDCRIVSTGYNGAPSGVRGCLKGGCPRGVHYKVTVTNHNDFDTVLCGGCGTVGWPCSKAVEPGTSYDTGPGTCIALHAEQNSLLYAFRSVRGATMYITHDPCEGCMRLIRGAQISRVVTPSSDLRLAPILRI